MPPKNELGPGIRLIDVCSEQRAPRRPVPLAQLVPVRGADARLVVKDVDARCPGTKLTSAHCQLVSNEGGLSLSLSFLALSFHPWYFGFRIIETWGGRNRYHVHVFQQLFGLGVVLGLDQFAVVEIGTAQLGRTPTELEAIPIERVFVLVARDVSDDGGLGDRRPLVLDRLAFLWASRVSVLLWKTNNGVGPVVCVCIYVLYVYMHICSVLL